jgi:hypothetical protein
MLATLCGWFYRGSVVCQKLAQINLAAHAHHFGCAVDLEFLVNGGAVFFGCVGLCACDLGNVRVGFALGNQRENFFFSL